MPDYLPASPGYMAVIKSPTTTTPGARAIPAGAKVFHSPLTLPILAWVPEGFEAQPYLDRQTVVLYEGVPRWLGGVMEELADAGYALDPAVTAEAWMVGTARRLPLGVPRG